MARSDTTSQLRAYLEASPAKPEEKAVAVLAASLRSSPELLSAFLSIVGVRKVREVADFTIRTEEPTLDGQDKIDLEILVRSSGFLRRRIWVEAKLRAPFDRRPEHQICRYDRALRERDRHRPRGQRVSTHLAVLIRHPHELRPEDQVAITAARAKVVSWQDTADSALLIGNTAEGAEWRRSAGACGAPLALANLDALLWCLEREDLDVSVTPPLNKAVLGYYERSTVVMETVGGIAGLVCDALTKQGWEAKLAQLRPSEPTVFRSTHMTIPPGGQWWTARGRRRATLTFECMPYGYDEESAASVWVGLYWQHPLKVTAPWTKRARDAGLVIDLDDRSSQMQYLGAYESFVDLIGKRRTAGPQAQAIADMIRRHVSAMQRIGPPSR